MAPSANRRTGYSRRAQYTTFFTYIAAALGALIGAVLLIVSVSDGQAFSGVRTMTTDAVTLPARPAASGRAASVGFVDALTGWIDAGRNNARLKRELAVSRARLAEMQAVARENSRLKGLLGLASEEPRPVVYTVMTGSSASSTRRFALIAAGSRDGVASGMPVRTPLGLIGRVLEVGELSARVMLLTDTQSVVPARRASDGLPGSVEGRGDGSTRVRLISLGINPLRAGDIMVTSGSGGLFRPNMAICTITSLTRDGGICRVLSDPAASEYVAVEPVWSAPVAPPTAASMQSAK